MTEQVITLFIKNLWRAHSCTKTMREKNYKKNIIIEIRVLDTPKVFNICLFSCPPSSISSSLERKLPADIIHAARTYGFELTGKATGLT